MNKATMRGILAGAILLLIGGEGNSVDDPADFVDAEVIKSRSRRFLRLIGALIAGRPEHRIGYPRFQAIKL